MPPQSLKARVDRLPGTTHRTQRAVAIAVVITQALIAVTGSVVRVTGSGLGCPSWPQCQPGSLVPMAHPEYAALNQWIEFGNRMLTGVVGFIAFAAFMLAYLDRPRREHYVRLAFIMPAGVVAQAVLGGITVQLDLVWWSVAIHLLASVVMVWLAVLLFHAVDEGEQPVRRVGPPALHRLLPTTVVILVGLLAVGTMVTGAGPHAGDPDTPRLDLPVETLAHVHAAFLFVFLGSLVAIGLVLRSDDVPRGLWTRYFALLAVVLAQGALGFVQFWTGVPELLVSLHMLGAMSVIIAMAFVWCGARVRPLTPIRTGAETAVGV
ncbi:MAG: COX15/CtaA family protein [Actinomycetota bacterium]|nr:COX15/CtaA family protein [Actinomycetota bacterium]